MAAKKGRSKKKGKGNKKEADAVHGPESDPIVLFSNYVTVCRKIGLEPSDSIKRALTNVENSNAGKQLLVDSLDEKESFGPGGCRALAIAILQGSSCEDAAVPKGSNVAFTAMKEIRIWRCNIGDDGVSALASILQFGGKQLQLTYLELLDSDVGPMGALALGKALSVGMNASLMTLNLDFNTKLGSSGAKCLCSGLQTNSTLKKLSMKHCSIDDAAGEALSKMLSFSKLAIASLDLTSNRLGGRGLLLMSQGLLENKNLASLRLTDNGIASSEIDICALKSFSTVLRDHPKLNAVDLLYNPLGSSGGRVLLNALGPTNKRITTFKVDINLESDLYKALYRSPTSKKGSKNKKKKSKKKKKK
mmetsp:Transcript_5633/g.8266  ORF Transcript_5633/g.8266 Transcript_5633/m.8266 type:complete len:362 (-) Transcript_5633:1824-2909(-)